MKVDNTSQSEEQVEAKPESKSYWQVGSYLGSNDKVEGFSDSDSDDEQECREDAPEQQGIDSDSSISREFLGASISNSFDSIVNAPSEENYLNDETSNEREGPSSLSLSNSSAENHLEPTALAEESVKRVATEETHESDSSSRSRNSARSGASILDDDSLEEEHDDFDDISEASENLDEQTSVRRKSRIEELKEQLGLVERQISDSASEESDASNSISTCDDSAGITSPAPTMDSAYDGEVEISDTATEDSALLNQGSSTSSSTGLQSILVKTSSDEKKKKNSEKRVQFDLATVESAPQPDEEPKSFWDVLDNMLVNTDLGILDRSCKDDNSKGKTQQKSLMDGMAKEVKFGNLDASSAESMPVVDFKAIDRLIAQSHRHANRLPSIPECTEQSFDASACDDQSLTEEQKRMGLTSLADMSVASNMSESIAESKVTAESEMESNETEKTKEKSGFFSGWDCGNLKCVTPDAKDMCGPTMKLPGMIALEAMNKIPMNENHLIHWTDSEQQNESISRSIQMANEHVNGAKAYLSMIDGVDSEDDSTVASENTARASNVLDDNSSITSNQSEFTADADTDTEQQRDQAEPPGWQTAPIAPAPISPKQVSHADPVSIFRDAPSSPRASSPREAPVPHNEDKPTDSSSATTTRKRMDPPTSPKPTQQTTATMEISEARKSRVQHQAQQKTRTRKPDPESFEASKPSTKPMAKSKPEPAKKKSVAKTKKMDPVESRPKEPKKSSPAKKTETTKPKKDVIELQNDKITPETTAPLSKAATDTKKKTHRRKPTPELILDMVAAAATTAPVVQPKLGSCQDPIVLVEEEVEPVKEETRDETPSTTTKKAPTPEQDGMTNASPSTPTAASKRLASKLQKKQAERQQLKEKLLKQMLPLYALKPDEIALILEVGTRDYLKQRKSYNLAYEQARWCVLAAQSNTDQSLAADQIQNIIREECQRFRQ